MPSKPKAPKAKVLRVSDLPPADAAAINEYLALHLQISALKEQQDKEKELVISLLKKHKATLTNGHQSIKLSRRKSWEYSMHLQTVEADLEVLKKTARKEGLADATLTEFPEVTTQPTPDAPAKKQSLLKRLTSRKG